MPPENLKINNFQVYVFNSETGKYAPLGKVKNFTCNPENIEEVSKNNVIRYNFPKEITFTFNNVIWFKDNLGKIYYMKTHARNKRIKKKYIKLYDYKYKELMNKYLEI